MITIITPMGGASLYEMSAEFSYPKLLNEVNKKTLFEYSQDIYRSLEEEAQRLFLLPVEQDKSLGLSAIVNIVTDGKGTVIPLHGETQGSLCSCLLSIDNFDAENELIIASADHFINDNAQEIINDFRERKADAGVLTFESLHPKWAYVKKDREGKVVESAEKKAISRDAIAGFFYFRKGSIFIEAAKSVIKKGAVINGEYYISSCHNELVLNGLSVVTRPLADNGYYNFYDNHAIKSFSSRFNSNEYLRHLAVQYIQCLNHHATNKLSDMCHEDVILADAATKMMGKANLKEFYKERLDDHSDTRIDAQRIYSNDNASIIEYVLNLRNMSKKGVDVVEWNSRNKITSVRTYLY